MIENVNINDKKSQLASVNLLRFLAAFFVMMYHYTFMFYERGLDYIDLPILRNVFHYGYLGVDLFFIISGFVIALSADGRDAREFVVSRLVRLYPMLWICVTITFLFFMFLGEYHYASTDIIKYLTNLTMVPTLFGNQIIDGSYWSLTVELKFYAFIFAIILLGLFKHLKNIAVLLSVLLFVYTFYFDMSFNWISYFLAGVLFFNIYKNGKSFIKSKIEIASLVLLMLCSVHYAISRAPDLSSGYGVYFDPSVIATHVTTFYVIFLFISLDRFKFSNTKAFTILGAITYPVYLLHQEIGLMSFKLLENLNVNFITAFVIVSLFILILSYLLLSSENILQQKLRIRLKRILYIK